LGSVTVWEPPGNSQSMECAAVRTTLPLTARTIMTTTLGLGARATSCWPLSQLTPFRNCKSSRPLVTLALAETSADKSTPSPNMVSTIFTFRRSIFLRTIALTPETFSIKQLASVKQRGVFDTGDTGFNNGGTPLFPASIPGNAIFSLYPFPNNPLGPYGANTYTEVLPADGRGEGFSIKADHRFIGSGISRSHLRWRTMLSFGAYGDQLVGRYSFNDEKSTIPVTGDALFSSLRPKVHTHNLAFFLDRHLSSRISDSIRVSSGRTKLSFGYVRDPFLFPS